MFELRSNEQWPDLLSYRLLKPVPSFRGIEDPNDHGVDAVALKIGLSYGDNSGSFSIAKINGDTGLDRDDCDTEIEVAVPNHLSHQRKNGRAVARPFFADFDPG